MRQHTVLTAAVTVAALAATGTAAAAPGHPRPTGPAARPTPLRTTLADALASAPATTAALTATSARATTLADGLVSPLTAAIGGDGTAYVSENFAGRLVETMPGQGLRTIYRAAAGTEVGGVSVRRRVVTFTTTGPTKTLERVRPSGRVTRVADLGAYEKRHNPDAGVVYGFRDISKACVAKVPASFGPARYHGVVDSHPYATTRSRRATYVAEAAGNDILEVAHGRIRTVALLPAVRVRVSRQAAEAFGLPACVAGHGYWFEPVPTDVERGPGGRLYVSTLTGGPEDGSLGALSRVYTVQRRTGAVRLVADGLAGATGLAAAANGDVYVAELFGGRIARIAAGTSRVTTVRTVEQPAAVEVDPRGLLYATTHVLADPPAGTLTRFRP